MNGGVDCRQGWSDLPDDLLDEVYRRCVSSLYDRARFASVCESWRAVATRRHPPLSALPVLLPSTGNGKRDRTARAYNLDAGKAVRASLQGFPWGKRIVGSQDGGWIAAAAGTRLFILNLFSGDRVELSARQRVIRCKCLTTWPIVAGAITIRKVIFSEDPTSSSCILCAITSRCKIALCRVGYPNGGWTTRGCDTDAYGELTDITFCNGNLFGLTSNRLLKFDIGTNEKGTPVVNLVNRIHRGVNVLDTWEFQEKYIFKLQDKLAVTVAFSPRIHSCRAQFFRVYELTDMSTTVTYTNNRWVEVKSLGDHALFLGPACCRAVHVPVTGGRSMVERNCIYYSKQHLSRDDDVERLKRLDLGSYTVYYGNSAGVGKIRSWGYHYRYEAGSNGCIWVMPPDF